MMDVHVRDNLTYLKDIQDGVQGQDIIWARGSTDVVARTHDFYKARGSIASPTIVSNADQLGTTRWWGYDGAAYRQAAAIQVIVDGVPGASDMPGAMTFYTTPDGSVSPTERLRVTSGGQLLAGGDGSVGSPIWSWGQDTDSGLYRIGADDWAAAVGGSIALEFVKAAGVVQSVFGTTGGSSSQPTITFSGDLDTGIYHPAANTVGIVAGGGSNIRFLADATGLSFFNATPVAKPTVTGAKGSNAALGSLMTALSNLGLVTDSTTA